MFVERLLKLSTAWKFSLHGPRNFVDWSWELLACCSVWLQQLTEGDFQQALEEGLSLFPVVQFKAKQRFIIEKIVERRDVFGQLIEESNLPNVAYKLGGLKIVRC